MKMTRDINIKEADNKELVAWYNENSGSKPITKFKDRETAIKRCKELYDAIKELSSGTSKGNGKKEGAKPATSKKEAGENGGAESETRGRKSKFTGKFIYRLPEYKDTNPRREGTHGHKSFSLIKDGMAYEAYIEAGGRPNDLNWDVDKGYVEVRDSKK